MTFWLLAGFFAFVLTAVAAAGWVFVLRPSRAAESGAPVMPSWNEPDLPAAQAFIVQAFQRMGEIIPGTRDERNPLRLRLSEAGYRWPQAITIFYGVKCASALLLATFAAWAAVTFSESTSSMFLPALCGLGFGFMAPDRILDKMAKARGERLRRGLPAALDLMVLGIEAGQGLDSAILETSRGLKITFADLAHEFTQLQLELRADTSRSDALRHFAERNREPEIRKFAHLMIDTDRFGTSLGPALKTHSKYLRIRVRQTAQERARKIGVKLIFPVFFLIFPSVVLVTLGPAAIQLYTQMNNIINSL
jgi:tight adherence protein C